VRLLGRNGFVAWLDGDVATRCGSDSSHDAPAGSSNSDPPKKAAPFAALVHLDSSRPSTDARATPTCAERSRVAS
jgi:hypothetical protein